MEILIKALVISLFCVGLRIISGEGMLLYFLRMPFDKIKERNKENIHFIEEIKKLLSTMGKEYNKILELSDADATKEFMSKGFEDGIKFHKTKLKELRNHKTKDWLLYIMKPVILCSTCMASFWTVVIELGYYNTFTLQSIIIVFVVAALNSIIHASYEKLSK